IISNDRMREERKDNRDEITVRYDSREELRPASRWVDVTNTDELEQRVRNLVTAAKFPPALHDAVVDLVVKNPKRTYRYDKAETERRQAAAVEAVPEETTPYLANNPVLTAGT